MEQVARQVDGVNVILGSHQGPPTGYLTEPGVIRGTIISKRAAWTCGSGSQDPSGQIGAVPETSTRPPTRTARPKLTTGS